MDLHKTQVVEDLLETVDSMTEIIQDHVYDEHEFQVISDIVEQLQVELEALIKK